MLSAYADSFPQWVVMAFLVLGWISRNRVVRLLFPYITYLDDRSITKVVRALRAAPDFVEMGTVNITGETMPKWGFSRSLRAAVTCTIEHAMDGSTYTVLVVYRPAFVGGPLVHAPPQPEYIPGNIAVLERTSNELDDPSLGRFVERAIAVGVPCDAVERATDAANRIVAKFEAHERIGCVFVLHGPPGIGKSLAARIAADKLRGVLFDDYDATSLSYCLSKLVYCYSEPDEPLVVVYEEFDVSLKQIMKNDVDDHSEKSRCDAASKAAWNKTLDRFCRKKNCLMIMTTNKTVKELAEEVCDGDSSLLRKGRIAEFIAFEQPSTSSSSDSDGEQ
jgi:hypothetical protein